MSSIIVFYMLGCIGFGVLSLIILFVNIFLEVFRPNEIREAIFSKLININEIILCIAVFIGLPFVIVFNT